MNLPKVGSQVVVTTKHKNIILGGQPFKYTKIEGTVIQPTKWMGANEFMVATSDTMRPKSIINLSYVSDIKYIKGTHTQIASDTRTFKVSSKSSGKTYIVTCSEGKVSCTCTGFEFRRYCKHSRAVSEKITGEKRGN